MSSLSHSVIIIELAEKESLIISILRSISDFIQRETLMMIPLRLKRKYAKANDTEVVDETNYDDPKEETSFIQERVSFILISSINSFLKSQQPPPSDTGSYETYARSDNGEYMVYDKRHNQTARRMHQMVKRIKMMKIVAILLAPLNATLAILLFRYPHLMFGAPCLQVNSTTTLVNATTTAATTTLGTDRV